MNEGAELISKLKAENAALQAKNNELRATAEKLAAGVLKLTAEKDALLTEAREILKESDHDRSRLHIRHSQRSVRVRHTHEAKAKHPAPPTRQ